MGLCLQSSRFASLWVCSFCVLTFVGVVVVWLCKIVGLQVCGFVDMCASLCVRLCVGVNMCFCVVVFLCM